MGAPVSEGDIVLDKYRVERVLGQGGMGVVVAATHVELDQKVALKFLLPNALEHSDIVERFAREAKAAAKIQSRHVVRVLDTGRTPDGAPFMVMEYLEGEDLSELLKRSGALALNLVADYVLQACEALGEAHASGIVHRDLKPSNLFLAKQRDRRSIVKVLDFGISKIEEPNAVPLTLTTVAIGSPHYMSPEQLVSSKHVDARTDIWSLGVILYELVAGARPFSGDTMPEIVAQILNNEPARVSSLRAGVSLEFENIVSHCLTTQKEKRYGSVAELAAALRPFATDAAAAAASVERTARVLGAASVPPAPLAADGQMVLEIDLAALPAPDDLPATLRPAAAKATPAQPEIVEERKVERKADLESTVTSPSNNLPALSSASSAEEPQRRGRGWLLVAAVVAIGAVAVLGLRGPPPSTAAGPPAESSEPHAALDAAAAADVASAPTAPLTALPAPSASEAPLLTKPATAVRSAGPAPRTPVSSSASARPQPTRDNLHMDIK